MRIIEGGEEECGGAAIFFLIAWERRGFVGLRKWMRASFFAT